MAAVSVADVIKLTKRENISAMDGSLPTDSTVSYDLIKALDFPMEGIADSVEDEDYHEKSQNLELPPCTPPSFDASSRPTFFNDNGDLKFKKPSTLYEQTSQIAQFPISNTQFFRSTSSNNSNSSPSENLYCWDASESDFEASLTEEMSNPVKRKQKKKRELSQVLSQLSGEEMTKLSSEEPGESCETTRCTHCAVTKTPQWREGPQGPKTLCNACGVRYRSGRPLSNYLPAASPMFSSEEPGEIRETKRCTHCLVTRTSQWREGPQGPKTLCNECGHHYRSGRPLSNYRPAASPTFSLEEPGESCETKRCTHCSVTKTSQWREGPLGPKTLCNACGVRYRSGHLFPDDRPAATTTFSSDKPGESRETKRCTQCAVTKTRQWREGPIGPKTLCNACGVRYRCCRLFQPYRPPASPRVSLKEPAASPRVSLKEPAASPRVSSKEPAASPTVSSKEPRESRGTKQCTHCAATKTPQWREGPQGRMTLCNACGVRYRSGRLFPEYRPAASPTFIASEHSNSHRKVIELRNKDCQGAKAGIW